MMDNCKTVMEVSHDFVGGRYNENGIFTFYNWTLSFEVAAKVNDECDDMDLALSVAFGKLNFFMNSILVDVFVIPINHGLLANDMISSDVNNTFVLLPETATDDIFAQALHSKLSAIVGETLFVGEMSLKCKQTNTKFYYFTPDGKYELPDQLEFVGDHALYDVPWWSRYDCDTMDLVCPEDVTDDEKIQARTEMTTSNILNDIEEQIKSERGIIKKKQVVNIDELRSTWTPKEV